jgi:hypothetical protein
MSLSNTKNKIKYWAKKVPEITSNSNLEPLTLLMIRTAGEAYNYITTHSASNVNTINSKDVNLLHSIDRKSALNKLHKRIKFLKQHKTKIKQLEKQHGFIDLSLDMFQTEPFLSINSEMVVKITKNKYLTLSGVGRICAIKVVFPEGINIKLNIGHVDNCLEKRLHSINNLYIYGLRFENLKKYKIKNTEIFMKTIKKTNKCRKRSRYLTKKQKHWMNNIIPVL